MSESLIKKIEAVKIGLEVFGVEKRIRELEARPISSGKSSRGGGSYTDEQAQDAVGGMIGTSLQYVDATPLLDTIQDIRTTASPTFANIILTASGVIKPTTDTTTALSIAQADGTHIMTFDTTGNKRIGIGTDAPASILHIYRSTPTITLTSVRTTGGLAFPFLDMFANNSVSGLTTRIGVIGALGDVGTAPTPPYCTYIYLGADPTSAYNDNAMRIYPGKIVNFMGNVGVGIAVPNVLFETNGIVRSDRTGVPTQYIQMNGISSGNYLTAQSLAANEKALFIQNLAGVGDTLGTGNNIYIDNGIVGSAATRVTIDYLGNIGVGITAPTAQLHIVNSAAAQVGFKIRGATSQSADLLQINKSDGTIYTSFDSVGKLVFGPSGAQDTNLYRSTTDMLKTDDGLTVTLSFTCAAATANSINLVGGVTGASPVPILKLGSYYDDTGNPSVSHIDLYGGQYGFGISDKTLNYFCEYYHKFYSSNDYSTAIFTVDVNGLFVDAVAYKAGGVAGFDGTVSLPTSITVKKGIVTAVS
jgi:hypothetical protein